MIVAGPTRRRLAVLALLFAVAALTGCATRPESGYLLPVAASAPGTTDHTILVATTRERDDRPGTFFNGERSPSLSYAEITVSVPPNHAPSEVQLASAPPGDPNTNFVVRDAELLDGDKAFVAQLNAQLALRPKGSRSVFVFVHGFNTMFAEGVFTATQLVHDARGSPRWRRVVALPLHDIRGVDPGRGDLDQDLALAGDRVRHVLQVEYLGPTRAGDDDRAHGQLQKPGHSWVCHSSVVT